MRSVHESNNGVYDSVLNLENKYSFKHALWATAWRFPGTRPTVGQSIQNIDRIIYCYRLECTATHVPGAKDGKQRHRITPRLLTGFQKIFNKFHLTTIQLCKHFSTKYRLGILSDLHMCLKMRTLSSSNFIILIKTARHGLHKVLLNSRHLSKVNESQFGILECFFFGFVFFSIKN